MRIVNFINPLPLLLFFLFSASANSQPTTTLLSDTIYDPSGSATGVNGTITAQLTGNCTQTGEVTIRPTPIRITVTNGVLRRSSGATGQPLVPSDSCGEGTTAYAVTYNVSGPGGPIKASQQLYWNILTAYGTPVTLDEIETDITGVVVPTPTYPYTGITGLAQRQLIVGSATSVPDLFSATAAGLALLDDASSTAQRATLGLVIGTNVQAYDADLTTYAGITPSANVQSVLSAADYAAVRTLLSLVPGTNVQAYDADLTTYAGITPSANVQSVLSAADYAAIRVLLGLVIGTNVQAYDADLTTYAGITPSANVQTILSAANYAAIYSALGAAPTATALATPRAIYGNNFDGSAALTQVIASTYGGTGNGFAKFSGPTTAEKTFTLPDASATLSYTVASGTKALDVDEIASTSCDTMTDTATGAATTDIVIWTPNADITAVTGHTPATTGKLEIYTWLTANQLNIKVCNPTASPITPGAVSLNWRVVR